MASEKHKQPDTEEPSPKRQKKLPLPPANSVRVQLNPADCSLDFDVDGNGLKGQALYDKGFAYCWSGARANVGITRGKYCFGCKVVSAQPVYMEDTPPDQRNLCRVGISRGDIPVGCLGESQNSYAFGGTGKFSNSGKFSDYGTKFTVGDTIICAVNFKNQSQVSIGFAKNGKWLGVAIESDAGISGLNAPVRELPWAYAMFPHVLLKNVVVEMQFSIEEGLIPEEGYRPWASALVAGNAVMGPTFDDPKDCEVLMMVGLPASGKTTWAEKHAREHPEKRHIILGTNLALDQMKVPGLLRKRNYGERFERLMNHATEIFNTLLARAANVPHNYILDQTNVYKNARKRKLRNFTNYHKMAVVVFPPPNELKARSKKRLQEMGKEIPPDAVNEMLANFVLPTAKDMPGADELFDEVIFTELNRGESGKCLDNMKKALCSAPERDFPAVSGTSPLQKFQFTSLSSNYDMYPGQVNSVARTYEKPEISVGGQHGYSSFGSECMGPPYTDSPGAYGSYGGKAYDSSTGYRSTYNINYIPEYSHTSFSNAYPSPRGEYDRGQNVSFGAYQSAYSNHPTVPSSRESYYGNHPNYSSSLHSRSYPSSHGSNYGLYDTYSSPGPRMHSSDPGMGVEPHQSYHTSNYHTDIGNLQPLHSRGRMDSENPGSFIARTRPNTFH